MEDQKEGVRKQQAEVTKLNAVIRDMEKDIIVLKKEIQERDDTIQDKVCQCSSILSLASAVLNPPVHILLTKSVLLLCQLTAIDLSPCHPHKIQYLFAYKIRDYTEEQMHQYHIAR